MKHTNHIFQENSSEAERRTFIVMLLTGAMMIVEIIAGMTFKSMALLADGWHMGTHLGALLIAVIAYKVSEKNKNNYRFTFGTGKIGVLGGYTSSILLLLVALGILNESVQRFISPVKIQFEEALLVAIIGLVVNIVSALILKDSHSHEHKHSHGHHHSNDQNLKAAYIHVVTDAFTSVTAIIALLVGLFFGIVWIDSLMGILGSIVIFIWAFGIIKDTVGILIDYYPKDSDLEDEIKNAICVLPDTKIHDLHIWQVSSGKFAAIIAIEAVNPKPIDEYYKLVNIHEELVHISIQVNKI